MDSKVKRRRDFLINIAFIGAILALAYVFFKYIFWVTAPFLLSFFIAVVLQKPIRWLDKKTKNKMHAFWSIILVLLIILIIIGPLALIIATIIEKIGEFITYLTGQMQDIPAFLAMLENKILDMIKFLPDKLYETASGTIKQTFTDWIEGSSSAIAFDVNTIKNSLSSGMNSIFSVVKNIPSVLIGVVIGTIATILFTKDYNFVVSFIKKQLPDGKKNVLGEMKKVFSKTILTMFKAYGLIMCITFIELFLGFSILSMIGILDNKYYVLIAVGTAIFDIMPVAGSGGILIPWAIIAAVTGNYKLAIGIIIIYASISIIRQYIEPKIVGSSLGVHPILTLMGLYFGLKLFGFIGMLIVPLTIMTLKALNDSGRLHLWKPLEQEVIEK